MDALARLLDPNTHLDEDLEDLDLDLDLAYHDNARVGGEETANERDDEAFFSPFAQFAAGEPGASTSHTAYPDEIVEEWRPMSPGGHCDDEHDRYDS